MAATRFWAGCLQPSCCLSICLLQLGHFRASCKLCAGWLGCCKKLRPGQSQAAPHLEEVGDSGGVGGARGRGALTLLDKSDTACSMLEREGE